MSPKQEGEPRTEVKKVAGTEIFGLLTPLVSNFLPASSCISDSRLWISPSVSFLHDKVARCRDLFSKS